MNYKRLGRSGLKVSRLSLGSWLTFANKVDIRDARQIIACALDAGVNFFDTAENYADGQAQVMLGQIFNDLGARRDSFCLSSKVFWGGDLPTQRGLSRKHINDACNKSLARLKTDYLDIYFCHRPDPDTPILETASAMHDLIVQGKVMYWGTSEWSPRQIRTAFEVTSENSLYPPVAEQPPYNLFDRQRFEYQTRPVAKQFGLGILSTTPLSSGILSGKYLETDLPSARLNLVDNAWLRERLSYQFEERWLRKLQDIRHLSDDFGITAAQLSIAWCMTDPVVTSVITGATSLRQIQENLATIKFLENLDKSTLRKLERFGRPRPILRAIDRLKFSSRAGRQAAKSILSTLRG